MGWVWRDETDDDVFGSPAVGGGDVAGSGDRCATKKFVRSQCKTEEIEPGKFIRKCEKTEEVLRECIGKPVEVLHSNKEYTEEDVTDQMLNQSSHSRQFEEGAFNFPGLRSDIEAIERQFSGGIKSFFDAAEEMTKSFFDVFGEHSSAPTTRRGIPVEDHPQKDAHHQYLPKGSDSSGNLDFSGMAKDV